METQQSSHTPGSGPKVENSYIDRYPKRIVVWLNLAYDVMSFIAKKLPV